MIASYIQELLSKNNRVIVPGFGAFLVRATSKYKSATDLSKKLNDIYFSPFLKFNDELLVNYIIKKEDISKDEAIEKINDFTELIKSDIEKGESFEIKDFGVFAIEEGKIQFTPATKAAKTAKPKETPETKKEETPKQVEAKKPDKAPAAKTTEKVPEKTKESPEKEKPAETKKEKPKAAASAKPPVPPKAPQSTASKVPPIKAQKEKKYNKGLVLALAIGIPAAALFVFLLLNLDTVSEMFKKDKKETLNTEQVTKTNKTAQKADTEKKNTDTTAKKEATKTTTAQKEEQKTAKQATQKPAKREKKFYVIAGSFEKKSNASRYQQSLIKKGYKAEMLPERNGMYAVSFNSFANKQKAMAELNYLTKEKKVQAWLLYY